VNSGGIWVSYPPPNEFEITLLARFKGIFSETYIAVIGLLFQRVTIMVQSEFVGGT